ncbi:restriction endonuclease fold toxin-2 domain-containing protein [Streptomyces cacaoi]
MMDGLRPADGYAIEAKHVRNSECTTNPHTLNSVDYVMATEPRYDDKGKLKFNPRLEAMYHPGDEKELQRYQAATDYPPNREIRGLEVVTNGPKPEAYWQSMMAMSGVKGETRDVP